MRLKGKAGIVVGAGQTPGETIGNGRAAALLFAREGAKLILVDRDLKLAEETAALIAKEGGAAKCFEGDWTRAADCKAYVKACTDAWGRLDFLHNNVGIGAGDAPPAQITEEAYDRIMRVNLKGCLLSCQAAVPVMREQQSGSIVNISSIAAIAYAPGLTAYKLSKIGMNMLGQQLALSNAKYGVRVNTIMPGLMDTPMAIEGTARARNLSRDVLRAERDKRVPLKGKMGTAWDVAHASLFLHSDEAKFITGVALPVDGGQSARVG
ncbi:MAG TPA: SDR family NAD(P)-dependent oxidoreductase [Burkholderiales bacterium]|nr:SDR family NAD(P)-dependent oxidoreductase [Burkholderiales bacterium]